MRNAMIGKRFFRTAVIKEFISQRANPILSTLIILSSVFLLYQYREGGPKDAGVTDTSIRDVGGYISTGIRILDKVNPYLPDGELWGGARWGTFGTIPLALLSELVPRILQVVFFQTLGLLGLYFFMRTILRKLPRIQINSIFLLLIWSSSYREMLTTNQIIGIVLGLIALGVRSLFLAEKGQKNWLLQVLGTLSFVIALDLKPHISGLFIVGLYLYFRRVKDFFLLIGMYVLTHAAVDIYLGRIVELDWLKIFTSLSDRADRNELGDSVTFWPVIRNFLDFGGSFGLISKATLGLLVVLTFWAASKRNWQMFIVLSFFAPAFSIYFHYYDAVPLLGLVFWALLSRRKTIFSFVVLDMLVITKEASSIRNIIFVIFVSAAVVIFSESSISIRLRNSLFAVVGFAIWQLIYFTNSKLNLDQYELQYLVVTQALTLAYLFLSLPVKKSKKLQVFA